MPVAAPIATSSTRSSGSSHAPGLARLKSTTIITVKAAWPATSPTLPAATPAKTANGSTTAYAVASASSVRTITVATSAPSTVPAKA